MPASLLDSQLETLEPPTPAEPAIDVDSNTDPQLVVDRIIRQLGLPQKPLPAAPPARKPPARKTAARKPAAKKPTPRSRHT
jgi:hypothetical protein